MIMTTKICTVCKQELTLENFCKCKKHADGLNYKCKQCVSTYHAKYYLANKEKICINTRNYENKLKQINPFKLMLHNIRKSAKSKGFECSITEQDLKNVYTGFCPVFEIELKLLTNIAPLPDSASVDRIDNSKGYTKDNIRIISLRANVLKSDSTIEELEKILTYMRQNK